VGRGGGTHDACSTSGDLEVGGDEIEGEFETEKEGGGKEGNVAATFDDEGAENGEGDEEGAVVGVSGAGVHRGMLTLVRACFLRAPLGSPIWRASRALRRACGSFLGGLLHSR